MVEGDGGGEGEEAAADPCSETVEAAGAVAFEGEDVLAGLEDRFDPLSDRCQVRPLSGFVFAAGAADGGVEVGGGVFELAAGVALIGDDDERAAVVEAFQHREADIAQIGRAHV